MTTNDDLTINNSKFEMFYMRIIARMRVNIYAGWLLFKNISTMQLIW